MAGGYCPAWPRRVWIAALRALNSTPVKSELPALRLRRAISCWTEVKAMNRVRRCHVCTLGGMSAIDMASAPSEAQSQSNEVPTGADGSHVERTDDPPD